MKMRQMTKISLLIAISVIMKLIGLGSVPIGPLSMSFLTLPIAIGAILIGIEASTLLGLTFGLLSFYDAMSGASAMTSTFLSISALHTFILCVGTRTLMGFCIGVIAKYLKSKDKIVDNYVISLLTPLCNTLFFMGYICLIFYHTDYISSIASTLHASNPLMFVILLVGMQGIVEAIVCCIVGGLVTSRIEIMI